MSNHKRTLNRREFLKLGGATVGAAWFGNWLTPEEAQAASHSQPPAQTATSSGSLRLGILSTPFTFYPQGQASFLAALQKFVAQNINPGETVEWVGADHLSRPSVAWEQTQALFASGVSSVIGLLNSSVASQINYLYERQNVPFIVSTLGANVERYNESSSFVAYNSLEAWQANFTLGQWAATNLGPRAFSALSFYDGGYDAPFAFQAGFEAAGGQVIQTFVSHKPTEPVNLTPLMNAIKAAKPNVVFASYGGPNAVDFMTAYAKAKLTRTPVVGSAWMADNSLLKLYGKNGQGLKTGATWGAQSDVFAVLGDNAGRRLATLFPQKFSPATPTAPVATLVVREVQHVRGKWQNVEIATTTNVENDPAIAALRGTLKTGWFAEYGCF